MNKDHEYRSWRSMSPEQYLKERVDDQLAWYSKKSATNKNWHFRLQLVTLIAAALVPVISLSSSAMGVRIVVAIVGSIAAVAAGVVALYQFRDLWIDYRSTAEQLKYERYLFLTGSEPYGTEECFSLFVNRVENIILEENRGWYEKINAESNGPGSLAEPDTSHTEQN
ncbi:MAG: DUF4231 domain-containing protein [Acidiferrobacterales bacterium]|nr:DUF4231 domain-containing protein [Acidiferrobacterales bacterium]